MRTMDDIAIRIEGLSKRYRIGARQEPYKTLRDALTSAASAPFRVARSTFQRSNVQRANGPAAIWALKDVSFEIKRGEVVGIIGRNGAGKSTLLKILSRITEPTEGCAEIHGRVGSLLEVGTGFHAELTGRENIYLNGAILGMRKADIDRRFDEIVAFAEVEQFLDTPVKHYSSGMYVRLAFTVAAHLEPEILLVDEVLAVGDAAFQKKCLGKMGDVAKEGRTVLFVSHSMAAIRSLCSHALLLSEGHLAFSGPPGQCIDRYLLEAHDDMPADIQTAALPRPSAVVEEGALRISRLWLDTPTGRAILHTGEPMILSIEFLSLQPLTDVLIAWSAHAGDGTRLFECRTLDSYGPIAQLPPGKYRTRCTLPRNPLNPGLYTMHVGARCASKGLDWLPDVMTFRVDSPERLESLWLELPSGFIRVASEWSKPIPSDATRGVPAV